MGGFVRRIGGLRALGVAHYRRVRRDALSDHAAPLLDFDT